jgi:cytidylate kinase
MRARGFVIAIDGPSGAGKSTAGRTLAQRLGYTFLDTGAMYRAVALKALESGAPLGDPAAMGDLARTSRIVVETGGRVVLDGRDVTSRIRSREVARAASQVSVHPEVRRQMVVRQREMGGEGGVVLDGRDIGTAVFPDAEVKFFVDADPAQRAFRRRQELGEPEADVHAIEKEIRARDHADSSRADSPLVRTPDAIYLDTTLLTPEETVEAMLAFVSRRQGGAPGR